jgi:hypothetical protein
MSVSPSNCHNDLANMMLASSGFRLISFKLILSMFGPRHARGSSFYESVLWQFVGNLTFVHLCKHVTSMF